MRKCARCGVDLNNRVNHPTQGSSLFGSDGIELCCHCGVLEENAIDEHGTNDIPELLEKYRAKDDVDKLGCF